MRPTLGEQPRGTRPASGNGLLLSPTQAVPLGLPGGIWVDIEQAAQHGKIRLMENEGRRFPEAVVHAVFQVVLSRTKDGAQQLCACIKGDRFARNFAVRCTGTATQPRPALFRCGS